MKRFIALAALGLSLAGYARADVKLSPDEGLVIRFEQIDTRIHLGGRLHLDYAFFDDDLTPIKDDFDVRRGRPEIDISVGDDWKAKFEYEFGVPHQGLRAAWVQWDGIDHLKVRVGNQIMPFGMEDPASSNDIVFNERSLASALGPSYGTGLVLAGDWRIARYSYLTLSSGVYAAPFGDDGYDRHRSDHVGVATRATVAPIARSRTIVQFGASVDYRSLRGANDWSAARNPESSLAPRIIGVDLTEVDSTTSFDVEAAGMFGPVLFQSEYVRSSINRMSGSLEPNADFDGAYAQLSWVITGEHHRYAKSVATFGGVKPKRRFGALELGVRWSMLDLTDSGVLGGKADDVTVALSWWIRENARLMFNYINVNAKQKGTLLSDDPQIFALRFIYHL